MGGARDSSNGSLPYLAFGSPGLILELEEVSRSFGEVVAVRSLSLGVAEGEFLTLLGPSGCGKTTVLRLIAGFESPDGGRIRFRDQDVTGRSPQDRGFGMVFQSYALFPHLNVFENVAFGLRSRGRPRAEIAAEVEAALARVDLAEYGERAVQALSGGQQQRVALARALAIRPPMLLLDEPLSNLDQALRVQTRTELRRLVKELGITALFVTHDQEEAFDLSDRIAVMEAGELRQLGSPRALYQEPANRFVAGFVGRASEFPVHSAERRPDGSWSVTVAPGVVWAGAVRPEDDGGGSEPPTSTDDPAGSNSWTLLVRPEELRFAGPEADGAVRGEVRDRRFQGALTLFRVSIPGGEVEAAGPADGPRVGEGIGLIPAPDARLHLFAGS